MLNNEVWLQWKTVEMARPDSAGNNGLSTSVGLLENDRFAEFNSKPSARQKQNISDERKAVMNGVAASQTFGSFNDPFHRKPLGSGARLLWPNSYTMHLVPVLHLPASFITLSLSLSFFKTETWRCSYSVIFLANSVHATDEFAEKTR